jgi:2-polyprenyl-3-methyl-5-hydroxy-6-metoxy-1,4-benzoquinol methylase
MVENQNMTEANQLTSAGHGESKVWDQTWNSLKEENVNVARQMQLPFFWVDCYCDDLWSQIAQGNPNGLYLEQGAGRGLVSIYLAKRGCNVTMLDLSTEGFDIAKEKCEKNGLPIPRFVVADARETGLPADSFDCIYNIGLLEHFDDPTPVLAEAVRLLKPSGKIFMVIVPAIPESHKWLVKLLFCPWKLFPKQLKSKIKQLLGRRDQLVEGMTRTELGADAYLKIMQPFAVKNVECIPYNAFHEVYLPWWATKYWMLPWYRLYRNLKKLISRRPALKTCSGLELCYLLTAEKT